MKRPALALLLALVSGCAPARLDLGEGLDGGADVALDAGGRASTITAGHRTTMVLTPDGTVWAWGTGVHGQLAVTPLALPDRCALPPGSIPCAMRPVRVPALAGSAAIALGMEHGCALRAGRVVCFGLDIVGQLGIGVVQDDAIAAPVDVGIDDAIGVATGDWHSCAIHADGEVSCWGLGAGGQLGHAAPDLETCTISASWPARFELPFAAGAMLPCSLSPRRVPGLTDVVALALGRAHTCALRSSGEVVCLGSAEAGQLGTGAIGSGSIVPVTVGTGIRAIAAGSLHGCALGAELSCWGGDALGQAGIVPAPTTCADGDCVPTASTLAPFGTGTIAALGAGDAHTCAVVGTEAWCFGNADDDTAGMRNATCSEGPCVAPPALAATGVAPAIAGGTSHTCAVALDGTILCWGGGAGGELGTGSLVTTATPGRVELR